MTTAVAMTEQLQLPSLDNCSCHVWTAAVAMPGQTAVAMYDKKCDCNVQTTVDGKCEQIYVAWLDHCMFHVEETTVAMH